MGEGVRLVAFECRSCGAVEVVTNLSDMSAACPQCGLRGKALTYVNAEEGLFEREPYMLSQCWGCARCWKLYEGGDRIFAACPVLPGRVGTRVFSDIMLLQGAQRPLRSCAAYLPMSDVPAEEAVELAMLGHEGAANRLAKDGAPLPCHACGCDADLLTEAKKSDGTMSDYVSASLKCPDCGFVTVDRVLLDAEADDARDFVRFETERGLLRRWNKRALVEPTMRRIAEMIGDGRRSMR